jgi:proline dehydrogenase
MLRSTILAAARSRRIEELVTRAPVSRGVVRRFVGGPDTESAVAVAAGLIGEGLTVSLDHLGEDTVERRHADAVGGAYLELLQALPGDGEKIALEHARTICAEARRVGATVTLDMEDHTTTDSTLEILRQLRVDFPETAAVLQAYLRRTESDCHDLSYGGSRVRLCKGAYREPASVAFQKKREVDLSYVRCMNVLLEGDGYPMFATHDPTLVAIAADRATESGKKAFEFQMLYGIRPDEQRRLAAAGHTVRVYIPYGTQWYGYLMRRLAERPENLAFFGRALFSKG